MKARLNQDPKSSIHHRRFVVSAFCHWVPTVIALTHLAYGAATPLATSVDQTPKQESALSEVAAAGESVFKTHCAVCHQAGATGQVGFAPSIRNRDFLALASDEYIRNTIRKGRTGTAMVARPDLPDKDVEAILAYFRSHREANPVNVKVDWSKRLDGDAEAGADKYAVYCASCHGPYGEGYVAGAAGTGIGLPGFWAVAADDYVVQTLKLGRMGTPMRPFIGAKGLANLSESDAHDIIAHLKTLAATFQDRIHLVTRDPDSRIGEVQFTVNCAPCHQAGGVGKVGFAPSIRNRDFLALASDEFIRNTVRSGRPGTGMLPRPDLPEQTLLDILAYLRALPVVNPVEVAVDTSRKITGDAKLGETQFGIFCAACHGPTGEGYGVGGSGPAIGYPGFLAAASDDYILQTLKHGRIGTPMKSFIGATGLANLEEQEAFSIIAYLRSMENRVISSVEAESIYE
jgi:cbb3-type cytochrome c oxidase subunit III